MKTLKNSKKIIVNGLFKVVTTEFPSNFPTTEYYKAESSEKCLEEILRYVYGSPKNVTLVKYSLADQPKLLRSANFSNVRPGVTDEVKIEIYRVEAITRVR